MKDWLFPCKISFRPMHKKRLGYLWQFGLSPLCQVTEAQFSGYTGTEVWHIFPLVAPWQLMCASWQSFRAWLWCWPSQPLTRPGRLEENLMKSHFIPYTYLIEERAKIGQNSHVFKLLQGMFPSLQALLMVSLWYVHASLVLESPGLDPALQICLTRTE